jgi:hypothetical protein
MTSTDLIGSVVSSAKAKIEAAEVKGLSYVPQILEAHRKVIEAEKAGHQRSLEAAIAAGELLNAAKDAVKGKFKWSEWRSEYLKDLPQTTASLYMRLAKNQDKLRKPDPATDEGKRISNGLLKLGAEGELSIKKVATLLATKRPRGANPTPQKTNEEIGKEWLKSLAADDVIAWVMEVQRNDTDYLKAIIWAALDKVSDDAEYLKALVAELTPAPQDQRKPG